MTESEGGAESYFTRTTARNETEVLAKQVVVPEDKHGSPDWRERGLRYSAATSALKNIFGAARHFVPTGREAETDSTQYHTIQDIYVGNLQKLKGIRDRITKYDMADPLKIPSKVSGGYLSCRSISNLCNRVIARPGQDEAWLLQPVLPGSVVNPRSKYLSLLGGSAVGMALGPLAVAGAVGAVGFGVGGIGAGTYAAWMMSFKGGATAAGGAVAALQSVGAAGLGATGMAASMSAGAAVGGSASAAARAMVGSNAGGSNGQDGDSIMHAAANVSEKTDGTSNA